MYLHLGKNESVPVNEIVGIFDIEAATISQDTKKLLSNLQEEKKVINLCDDLPKSFVLTENELYECVYISQISASSLEKRAKNIQLFQKSPKGMHK